MVCRFVGLNMIASLKKYLGDLDKVNRIVRLTGFCNCIDGFDKQALVIDGCSNLFHEVFQEKGHHARTDVGVNALPLNVVVEVEGLIEIQQKND